MIFVVINKNPNHVNIFKLLKKNTLNYLLYEEPVSKINILSQIMNNCNTPILYLDFDLLYSGYINTGLIKMNNKVVIKTPTPYTWKDTLRLAMNYTSNQRSTIILDSLNGLSSMLKRNSTRIIYAHIMLLGLAARHSKSTIVIPCMAKKSKEKGWTVAITGGKIINLENETKIHLKWSKKETFVSVV